MNTFRTTVLLAVLTALLVWAGDLMGGRQGALIALIFAGGMNFFSYWFSDKMVIAMYQGQEITANDDSELLELFRIWLKERGCLCPGSISFLRIPQTPLPPGAIPNMRRSPSPRGSVGS